MFRFRLQFAKTQAMRFTGHLDLFRTWERTIRRARLPLAYSQGFSPHPRINLASALPLGFTSDAEVIDFWLTEMLHPEQIIKQLVQASPPGILIKSIETVDLRQPALQTQVLYAEFTATLPAPVEHLADKIQTMVSNDSIFRIRRKKSYNLRPLIASIRLAQEDGSGEQQIKMRLSASEGATGRPEEVLEALGIPAKTALIHRTALIFNQS